MPSLFSVQQRVFNECIVDKATVRKAKMKKHRFFVYVVPPGNTDNKQKVKCQKDEMEKGNCPMNG